MSIRLKPLDIALAASLYSREGVDRMALLAQTEPVPLREDQDGVILSLCCR